MSESSSPITTSNPTDLHDALQQVRQLKEFEQLPKDDPLESFKNTPAVRQFLEQLQSGLDHIFSKLHDWFSNLKIPTPGDNPGFLEQVYSYTVLALLLFAGVVLIYFVLITVGRVLQLSDKPPKPERKTADGLRLLNSEQHWRHAQELAQSGAFEQAIHQLYLAMLCQLDETKQVPFETNRTNLEYLVELKKITPRAGQAGTEASLVQTFKTLASTFEAIHYGRQPRGQSDFDLCSTSYKTLRTGDTADGGPKPHV